MLSLPPRSVSGINDMHLSISGSDPSCVAPRPLLLLPPHPPPPLTSRLVTCSTCSSNLVLPPYVSREQLIAKLRMSIAEKTFGLA